jgi:exodeoxyribonuclease V alpha subunit
MPSESVTGKVHRVYSHNPSPYSEAGMGWLVAELEDGSTVMGEMRIPESGLSLKGETLRFYGGMVPDKKRHGEMIFRFDTHETMVPTDANGLVEYLARHIDGMGVARAKKLVSALGTDALHILRTEPERVRDIPGFDTPVRSGLSGRPGKGKAGPGQSKSTDGLPDDSGGEAPPYTLADSVIDHFENNSEIDPAAYIALVEWLAPYKVSRKLIVRIVKDFKSDAPGVLQDNPYLLIDYPGIGWPTADAFALKTIGYPHDGPERHRAAICEAIRRETDDGHTVARRIDVESSVFGLIGRRPTQEAWATLIGDGDIVISDGKGGQPDGLPPSGPGGEPGEPGEPGDGSFREALALGDSVALPHLHNAEMAVAARLALLAHSYQPIRIDLDTTDLSSDQEAAARFILDSGVAILCGPPGVGKTFTVSHIVKSLMSSGVSGIRIMAPTGKAAKRAAELLAKSIGPRASRIPCTTIHKALGIGFSNDDEGVPESSARVGRGRSKFGFCHHAGNPLKDRVYIIDECSMLDISLFASLLSAIPLGSMVLLVGDENQLPSVGPGSALRDMIAAGVPTFALTEILRSDGGGRVVRACHAIKDGRIPEPAERFAIPSENWIHIEARTPESIVETICALVQKEIDKAKAGTSRLNLDPFWDVQVISTQKARHPFGCYNLNERLSTIMNPRPTGLAGNSDDLRFRIGDKIIRKKNAAVDEMVPAPPGETDWTWGADERGRPRPWQFVPTAVVNGDMGVIEDIVIARGSWVVVRFRNPDRLCRLPLGSCYLERAYAITGHSSQGSGYPYVIIPVSNAFYFDEAKGSGLWCREQFYTELSRIEDVGVTVGEFASIGTAVRRKTLWNRRTRLAERIRARFAEDRARREAVEMEREAGRERVRAAVGDLGDPLDRKPKPIVAAANHPSSMGCQEEQEVQEEDYEYEDDNDI